MNISKNSNLLQQGFLIFIYSFALFTAAMTNPTTIKNTPIQTRLTNGFMLTCMERVSCLTCGI